MWRVPPTDVGQADRVGAPLCHRTRLYEMYPNGTRVGDDHDTPGLSQYNVTHF